MVNDKRITTRPARLLVRPANTLGELGVGVGKEQLQPSAYAIYNIL